MPEPADAEVPLRPRALRPGAKVALVAPGGPLEPERLETSRRRCRRLGLEPVLFPAARGRSGFLSASDAERLADLQDAFDDPEIDAVWALRGGYGAIRIVDGLRLGRQHRDPIPFIGFSDNTVFHLAHAEIGVVSFHGPHPGGEFPAATEAAFRRVLFAGDSPEPPLIEGSVAGTRTGGIAEGPVWGGNLATLASLCGSASPLSADGRILCLEDIGEPAYRIDRMWVQLERAGVFRGGQGRCTRRIHRAHGGRRGSRPHGAPGTRPRTRSAGRGRPTLRAHGPQRDVADRGSRPCRRREGNARTPAAGGALRPAPFRPSLTEGTGADGRFRGAFAPRRLISDPDRTRVAGQDPGDRLRPPPVKGRRPSPAARRTRGGRHLRTPGRPDAGPLSDSGERITPGHRLR